ncbi:MAG: sulfotransferase family 2 domain-containing protein [Planctomycetota bacterium]
MYPVFDVLPEKRIAYLVLRKCGCSSIRLALSKLRNQVSTENCQLKIHSENEHLSVRADQFLDHHDWFKFTVVRDPIKRFLSFFSSKILDQNIFGNHTFLNFDRFGFVPNMSMDQVIDVLVECKFETEPHLVPQTDTISASQVEFDWIGKLEQIAETTVQLRNLTGVDFEFEQVNSARLQSWLPTKSQFERLADFYQQDIVTFDYPNNYEDWCDRFLDGRESKFQIEQGYQFKDEAKLLKHSVNRTRDGFLIDLTWRLEPRHSCKRVIRVMQKKAECLELLWHAPPKLKLARSESDLPIVNDAFFIPANKIPAGTNERDLYFEIYFCDDFARRVRLTNYVAHQNMLLFPFGTTSHGVKKSA